MKDIIFQAPINSLSFGNVSYNILREAYKQKVSLSFFPIGQDLEFSAFDKTDKDLKAWIIESYNDRFTGISKDTPSLKLWHLNGAESGVGANKNLFSFYETSEPTKQETSIAGLHNNVIFSSNYAASKFKDSHYCPLGFDEDFHNTNKQYLTNKIHFGLMGKYEKRKHTSKIIRFWAEKFGNDPDYQLTCCINNPFMKESDTLTMISNALDGKNYKNINLLPRLKTNSEVNEFLNSLDIDLSGLSGAEGWNLPAFNATCLGKWSIVLNATSHKDWADKDNSILVEPSDTEPCYDGVFFKEGNEFNQGHIYSFSQSDFDDATDRALLSCKSENAEGLKVAKKFTYSKTLKKILELINE